MVCFDDFVEIILNNWDLFKDDYVEKGVTGERREKLAWIEKIATIKKDLDIKPFIDKDKLDFLKEKKELFVDSQ